jgi:glycosyltransferase involved in cell wall biosynthesis
MLNQIDRDSFLVDFKHEIAAIFPTHIEKIALLVSSEYEGYYKNGGIGTYYNALSQRLAAEGWYVILLLCATEDRFLGKSKIAALDLVFSVAEVSEVLNLQPIHQAILTEAQTDYYDYQSFSILFFVQALLAQSPVAQIYAEFPEMCGFGYRTIQAKQVGLIPRCITSVTLHSGHEWVYEANEKFTVPYPKNLWQTCHYEQNSFENADLSFHPSNFIRNKVASYGWKIDRATRLPYFIPPIKPSVNISQSIQNKLKSDKIPLIFFARLEERKGLCTFLEAFKSLDPALADRCQIIFLGKIVQLYSHELRHLDSQQYIEQQLGDRFKYDIFANLFSAEALQVISSLKGAIVCLTSPQDNFPNSALEVGQLPVSIVAADTGGFRETLGLLERSSCVHWFKAADARSLSQVLAATLAKYPESPEVPTSDFLGQLNQSLLEQRMLYIDKATSPTITTISPVVTICIFCQDGDSDLLEGLTSLHQQTYQQWRIVLVDVGVETKETQQTLMAAQIQFPNLEILRLESATDASNLDSWLASIEQTDWVLFWRANDIASDLMLESLVQAAGMAETAIALCPSLINLPEPQVDNLRVGTVAQLLVSNLRNMNLLVTTKFLNRVDWSLNLSIHNLTKYLLAMAIATAEKIAYFPYPLSWTSKTPPILSEDAMLREFYQMRQYLASIEPSAWNVRQIYMLETGIQHLALKSGVDTDNITTGDRSFKSLAGYDVSTLIKASAWKIAKKSYTRMSRYENLQIVASIKRWLVKFFSENNI